MKSESPSLSRGRIESIVLHSTVRVRGVVDGRIDAARAVRSASSATSGSSDPTATPTPTPTYNWHDQVDGDTQRASHTFQLSGGVNVRVEWSSGVTLWVRIADANDDTVAVFHGSHGALDWSGSVKSVRYTVTVCQFAHKSSPFKVAIDD